MAAVRSRIRSRHGQPGEAGASAPALNPYMLLALLVGLVGTVLVTIALSYHVRQRIKRDEQLRLARGFALLDELDDLACDYYYNEKDKVNNGRLPDEAWAPFRKHMEAGDLFDAVITTSYGAEDRYADACQYRDGKAAGGIGVSWEMGRDRFYGPPGPPPEPKMAQIQVIDGFVVIGQQRAPVLFFRRPILHPKHGTAARFGRAVIILLKDAPVPEPVVDSAAPTSSPPPPADPVNKGESGPNPDGNAAKGAG